MNVLAQFKEHQAVMAKVETMLPLIEAAAARIVRAIQEGGKVLLMGNGGSAADAQHLAAELIGRYKIERRALPALALTTDSSILTAISNDYDASFIFARQIEAWCTALDVVIAISTSGNSANVLKGVEAAKARGAFVIGLSGQHGGQLAQQCDLCFCVPSTQTPRIQEAHIFIGHSICEVVEQAFALVPALEAAI